MRISFGSTQKLVFYSSLGGLLEFYDFVIYALLASYISQHFFSSGNTTISLLATFSTFALGYLVRPLGGVIFGHLGDKYGRKKPFVLSVFIMASSTFLMGCIPTEQTIGLLAPIILILLRMTQGLSLGGEIPGSITYISELSEKRRGLYTAILFCGITPGVLLGTLVIGILLHFITNEQMMAWGWRIPFLLGGVLGIVNYFLRKRFQELPLFQELKNQLHKIPALVVIKYHIKNLLAATFLTANAAICIVLLFLFIPTYLDKFLHFPVREVSWYASLFLFISILLYPGFGFIADKTDKTKWLAALSILSITMAFPIFYSYMHKQLLFPFAMSALLMALCWGFIPGILADLFPVKVRYSGIGISYNLALAIFGGLAPAMATLLIHLSHNLIYPAFILLSSGILSLIGTFLAKKILVK